MNTSLRVLLCTLAIVVIVSLYVFDPSEYFWMPKCPTKLIFGIDCPGCGLQRAIHALLHGDIVKAINYNPFLVFALPYAITAVSYRYIRNEALRVKIGSIVESKFMVYSYIVTFSLWFIIRNI